MKSCIHKVILFAMLPFAAQDLFAQPKGVQSGSIIITLISSDTIWIGADSRTSSMTDRGYTANKQGMCKIHNTNNYVYAMAGHVRYADNSFNFLDIMDKAAREHTNFDSAVALFKQLSVTKIRSILEQFSRKSIQAMIDQNNGAFLSVIVLSFVDNTRRMKEIRFSIQRSKERKYNVSFKETSIGDVGTLRFIGHASTALEHVRKYQFYFGNGLSVPKKMEALIKLEAVKSNATVGLPADVISVYNNGFKWVISSGLCQK